MNKINASKILKSVMFANNESHLLAPQHFNKKLENPHLLKMLEDFKKMYLRDRTYIHDKVLPNIDPKLIYKF
jgi:hypothetical protein